MDEYIDKEKVWLAKFTVTQESEYARGWNDALDAIAENAIVTGVAPVVHARWEWFDEEVGSPLEGSERDWGWRCSACKDTLNDEYDNPDNPPNHNYCPNCGSRMDGEQNAAD